jgi:hypothetical protein
LISHPAKKEGIGPVEVLDRVTMQVFVRDHCTMIAAPVQCDVDGIPKGSHYVRVPIAIGRPNVRRLSGSRRAEGDERVRCTRVLGNPIYALALDLLTRPGHEIVILDNRREQTLEHLVAPIECGSEELGIA